jgi:hypothetical protein
VSIVEKAKTTKDKQAGRLRFSEPEYKRADVVSHVFG